MVGPVRARVWLGKRKVEGGAGKELVFQLKLYYKIPTIDKR